MRIYLDVCCLGRPFDDLSQDRVRAEADAVGTILGLCAKGIHQWLTSEVVENEVLQDRDVERRELILGLLETADGRISLTQNASRRAIEFARKGIGTVDALHLALAEDGRCDILLTTDDRFIRRSMALEPELSTGVKNPVQWLKETHETW